VKEVAACRGKAHADMRGSTRYGYRVPGRGWANYWKRTLGHMTLRWGQPAPAPKPAPTPEALAAEKRRLREKRLAHAEQMVATWERRQKLATTHLQKWKRRVRAQQRGLGR
jgi:hypothetical protein